jgi:hypothetical protein
MWHYISEDETLHTIRFENIIFYLVIFVEWPPLWSSGQEFLATNPEARVRFPHYKKKKVVGLERGPLSLVEYNWRATW